jgi:outer membrane protein
MHKFVKMVAGTALLATCLVPACRTARAADVRIGYIDVPRVLEEYQEFKDARKDLDRERQDREDEYAKKVEELKKMGKDLKEKGSLLTEAKRRAKETEFMKKQQEIEEWRATQSKELAEKEEGLVKRLEADVRRVLEKVAVKEKMTFVVRRDLFLYMQPDAKDLTGVVLEELRKQSKEKK